MYKKSRKKLPILIAIIIILSFVPIMQQSIASHPHSVKGALYINDELAPENTEIKLEFSDGTETTFTYEYDIYGDKTNYNFGFWGHEGKTGYFHIKYQGDWYEPEDNKSVLIENKVIGYFIDLHVDTTTNNPPNKPDNPDPEDGETNVDLNPDLSVDVSDPDGDTMDVSFYDASDDSLIGTDNDVDSGDTATVEWSGLDYNTEYEWYVVADDSEFETQSNTWSFTTIKEENNPPNKPDNPDPEDGAIDVDINPDLSVDVTDPDGDPMDVSFYDASDDSLIDTDNDVPSGSTATVQWTGLDYNTEYSWYAIADDGELTTKSETWGFTTKEQINKPPNKPDNPDPEDGATDVDINPDLSVDVTDPDGDPMDVTFYDASDDSPIDTDNNVPSGSTATVKWTGLDYNTEYNWYAIANDSEYENKSDTWSFTTKVENQPPDKPTDPSPEDGETNVDLDPDDLSVDISVIVTDPDEDQMDVSFYNASDDSLINIAHDTISGNRAEIPWMDLDYNTTYSWYAIADDGEFTTKSDTWSFKTKEIVHTDPTVKIIKPEKGIYLKNRKIFPRPLRFTLIIGDITVVAEAEDEDGIEKVEFYINNKLKGRDVKAPYTFEWHKDRMRFCHFFVLKVVAYDNDGAQSMDRMIVRKFL